MNYVRSRDAPKTISANVLKREHQYYFQIQGELGNTGASWCDFVIYTNKGMSIERITFNPQFWDVLNEGLKNSYFEHFIAPASAEFSNHWKG